MRARAQGQLTACKSNLKNIGTALEMYSTDYGGKYPKNLGQLTPNYLKTIPECVAAGENTYTYFEGPSAPLNEAKEENYTYLHCEGEHHANLGMEKDYPKYTSVQLLIDRPPTR